MSANEQVEPNLFELRGEDGSEITYSTTTVTGVPELSYQGPHGENVFSGESIATSDTELGSEVTVDVHPIRDGNTRILTVILPPIRMEDRGDPVSLKTFSVFTTKKSSIAGPPAGQDFSYEVTALTGEARFVVS